MNKTLKKTLSIILTILMIVTTVPFAFAAGDGTPLTIDLSDVTSSFAEIGNGYTYYDEDGYIITGTNTNVSIDIYDSCDITFNDMSAYRVCLWSDTEENVTVTLDGDNYLDGSGFIFSSTHLTINGDDDDTLTIESDESAFSTSDSSGTLTVNGGKINAVTETTTNYSTITCYGGFTLNGGEVTASNDYYYVIDNKTVINGGTLNVISTSPDSEAINDDIEIAKGALLTASATYKVFDTFYNITPINEAEENLSLFARFDIDSDFAPVSDIKAALDGKTYAEIKVDTHEHDLDNSGKCICGYECPHENITDDKCDDCGTEGKFVTITMNDSVGDSWNGSAIVIEQLIDGTYTEVATATIENGNSGTFTALLPKDGVYAFSWVEGEYPGECSFTVAVNGETVYEVTDGRELADNQIIYILCEHSYTDGKCDACGSDCPHENVTDDKCDDCGTEGKFVTITMNDGYYDGWTGNAVVIEQLIDGVYTEVARATIENGKNGTFAIVLPEDGVYAFSWVEGEYPGECSFTVAVNGETVYEVTDGRKLANGQIIYVLCEHSAENGICSKCGFECGVDFEHEVTDYTCTVCGKYMYAITHQPTEEEPYVELNDNTDASYQWYSVVDATTEITDENASGDWQSLGAPFNNSVYEDGKWIADNKDSSMQFYFMVELEAGDIINFEFATEVEGIMFGIDGDFDGQFEVGDTKYSITVKEAGTYWLMTPPVDYVRATIGDVEYTPVEGQTSATLTPTSLGNYACEVTFADGTKEMSDIFEVTKLHDCDFSGEWKYDGSKHWKECVVDGCDKISEEATHSFTDGKCVCGVARADYTAFDAAAEELRGLLEREDLLYGPKQGYTSGLNDVLDGVGYNRIEKEQMAVDNGTQTLNGYIAALEAGIENGSMIKADFTYMTVLFAEINELIGSDPGKIIPSQRGLYTGTLAYYNGCSNSPTFTQQNYNSNIRYEKDLEALLAGLKDGSMLVADYTAIDEAINAIDETLENATISEEMTNELDDIKADLEALKENASATMADVNELLDRAEAIAETMDNCAKGVHSFTKYEETEAPKCGVAGEEVATCDNGCGATDEGEITALEHSFADYTSNGDATCEADGTKTATCLNGCGTEDTVADEGSKLDHADEDGDKICDDCQTEIIDTCSDCGRSVHEGQINEFVCLLITFIKLVVSFINAVS